DLGIAFNGDSLDENYFGLTPPALGLLLLQGPKVQGNSSDSALFLGKWINGYKNLSLTSFNIAGTLMWDPRDFNSEVADFNAIRGLTYYYGKPIINPVTKDTTTFVLEGNPAEKTGWFTGDTLGGLFPINDLRIYLSSGPFTMAPGDSQEVAVALIAGQGSDNLQSVTEVIEKAKVVQYFYKNYDAYSTSETYNAPVPEYYRLSQNYPNPFNPSTKIDYDLPVDGLVTLEVFNIVGERVSVLVNELQTKGMHSTTFNASSLPSGIYFYSLSSLNYFKTKKMILIK
ncbi:MAG: T9SS type A sorting domain-containing protein, partial [Ignavibacteria bacterium]|nr:T9SS type A sorting domain-containing protein [Ignavibacteria bacterium]